MRTELRIRLYSLVLLAICTPVTAFAVDGFGSVGPWTDDDTAFAVILFGFIALGLVLSGFIALGMWIIDKLTARARST